MTYFNQSTFNRILVALCLTILSACGGNSNSTNNQTTIMPPPLSAAPSDSVATANGPRNQFAIKRTSNSFAITDKGFVGGTTTLLPTQTSVKFSDFTVNLLVGDKSKTIPASSLKNLIELYIAFFNRVPDANGMSYWIDQIKAGMTSVQLANNFYNAALQYSDLTHYNASMSNADFVRIIYQNVLGRNEVDQGGLDYWTGALTSGKETRGSLINTIVGTAHNYKGDAQYGWVADLLDNKIAVGTYFSINQGLNYNTDADSIAQGMKIAALITATDTSKATALIGVSDTIDLTAAAPAPQVTMQTSLGTIIVELNPTKAPITAANFLSYTNAGFYDNLIFHRVINGFMIQGGGLTSDMLEKATKAPIKLEVNNGLSNVRGTIAMARTSVLNSATSQFFINVVDNVFLDTSGGGYAVFGKVVSGMDVVDKIKVVSTSTRGVYGDVPVTPIVIISAKQTL